MMKIIAGCWLLFIVLTATAIVIGRSDRTKPLLQTAGFDTCAGKPCYLGITSTLTTWVEATRILTLTGTVTNEGQIVEVYAGDSQTVYRIVPESDSKTVAHLEMFLQNNLTFPPLRELIRQYGVPCGVVYPSQTGNIEIVTLLYPAMYIEVAKGSDSLNLDMKITDLTFVDPLQITGNEDLCTLKSLESAPVIPWYGFASWEQYKRRGLFRRLE